MDIRPAISPEDIAAATALDETVLGSSERAAYIVRVAEGGGLGVAIMDNRVQAFSCLDHRYFFEKPFISLLIVAPEARRLGLGTALLSHAARAYPELWTSTNRSNTPMRGLLETAGWEYCGEFVGLDDGDPERVYKRLERKLEPATSQSGG